MASRNQNHLSKNFLEQMRFGKLQVGSETETKVSRLEIVNEKLLKRR